MVYTLHGGRRLAKRRRAWRMPDSYVDWTGMQAARARRDDLADAVTGAAVVTAGIALTDLADDTPIVPPIEAMMPELTDAVVPDGYHYDDGMIEATSELVGGDDDDDPGDVSQLIFRGGTDD